MIGEKAHLADDAIADMGLDELALEDEPGDVEAEMAALMDDEPEPPGPGPAVVPIIPVQERFDSRVLGMRAVTVYLDRFTHSSGNQRAFVHCGNHANCRRYIFVKDYETKQHAVAFLMAWFWAAPRWPDRGDRLEHIRYNPSGVELADAFREQFGD